MYMSVVPSYIRHMLLYLDIFQINFGGAFVFVCYSSVGGHIASILPNGMQKQQHFNMYTSFLTTLGIHVFINMRKMYVIKVQ